MNNKELTTETLNFILATAKEIAQEANIDGLCSTLLKAAMKLTGAEGATLYLTDSESSAATLRHALLLNTELDFNSSAFGDQSQFPDLNLYSESGAPLTNRIANHCFHKNCSLNISVGDTESWGAFKGPAEFDSTHNYKTHSVLCTVLRNNSDNPMGALQLINARNEYGSPCAFTDEQTQALEHFAHFAAASLQKQQHIDEQRNLLVELSSEPSIDSLLDRILREAKKLANAEAGTLYLLQDDEDEPHLSFALLVNDRLEIDTYQNPKFLPTQRVPLTDSKGKKNMSNVASAAVHKKSPIAINDAYNCDEFDFSGTQKFDEQFEYHSESILVIPLLNHDNEVIGILQLINAREDNGKIRAFPERSLQLTQALASYAAIGLNNQLLVEELKNLLDAFIKCIAQAIDAKSPHTSAHCQRIPLLTEMIAKAACDDQGIFKEFSLDEDEWYELNVASWLHDCGKLATPDTLLDKATKLHLMSDQIETIKVRFACMIRQAETELGRKILKSPENAPTLIMECESLIAKYRDDLAFIEECNKGSEFMAREKQQRIKDIAKQQWIDSNGESQPLLSDEQVYNLSIQRGTLTAEERQAINDHMVVTLNMLESLPFPKKLRRVPEYAGGHHERMDGTGFPRGLTRDQLSIPARMMAVADVFEALTASDRPYKEPMKVSKALAIMNNMVKNQHLDPDIFELFTQKQVWKEYAHKVLKAEQLDLEGSPRF